MLREVDTACTTVWMSLSSSLEPKGHSTSAEVNIRYLILIAKIGFGRHTAHMMVDPGRH
jgi:hypothetical protein